MVKHTFKIMQYEHHKIFKLCVTTWLFIFLRLIGQLLENFISLHWVPEGNEENL